MLTKTDLTKIGNLIDTKLESKLEEKLESKLVPIRKSMRRIEKKLDTAITVFDRDFNYHHRRLVQLEEKVGVKPPPFIAASN